jgi:hypothetical protein
VPRGASAGSTSTKQHLAPEPMKISSKMPEELSPDSRSEFEANPSGAPGTDGTPSAVEQGYGSPGRYYLSLLLSAAIGIVLIIVVIGVAESIAGGRPYDD